MRAPRLFCPAHCAAYRPRQVKLQALVVLLQATTADKRIIHVVMNLLQAWLTEMTIDRSRMVNLAVAYQQFSSVAKPHHVSLMPLLSCTTLKRGR